MNEWMNEYDMHKNKFVVCFRLLTRKKCELRPSESVKIKFKKLFKTIDASQSGASEFILFCSFFFQAYWDLMIRHLTKTWTWN